MKHLFVTVIITVIFIMTSCAATQNDENDNAYYEDRFAELELQNEELQEQVDTLERQVEDLQTTIFHIEDYLSGDY